MLYVLKVLYRMSRTRLMTGMLAFATSFADNANYRAQLKQELADFRHEYNTLMYGGKMMLQVRGFSGVDQALDYHKATMFVQATMSLYHALFRLLPLLSGSLETLCLRHHSRCLVVSATAAAHLNDCYWL